MKDVILHGECLIHKIDKMPKGVGKVKTHDDCHVIAPSETSGNHHVIDIKEGVEFYEKDGVLYLKNDVETDVRCIVKERHDNITLEPGIWEIDKQQEYDYFTESHRNIAD
jgi:hypothetical protein